MSKAARLTFSALIVAAIAAPTAAADVRSPGYDVRGAGDRPANSTWNGARPGNSSWNGARPGNSSWNGAGALGSRPTALFWDRPPRA